MLGIGSVKKNADGELIENIIMTSLKFIFGLLPPAGSISKNNCIQKALVSLKPDSQNLQPKCHQKHNIPKFASHDFSNFMPAARKSVCSWYGSFVKWVSVHKSGVRYP